jgi:hypothetical protein
MSQIAIMISQLNSSIVSIDKKVYIKMCEVSALQRKMEKLLNEITDLNTQKFEMIDAKKRIEQEV